MYAIKSSCWFYFLTINAKSELQHQPVVATWFKSNMQSELPSLELHNVLFHSFLIKSGEFKRHLCQL